MRVATLLTLMLFLLLLQPANAAGAQVVHAQQRAVTAATPAEVVAIATGQGVRAVTQVTASAVVSTTLSPVQSQTRPLVTQVTQGTEHKPLSYTHLKYSRAHLTNLWSSI